MNASDPELLSRIARGETAAFSAFYDRHGGRVFALLLRLVAQRRDAEALLQEAFWDVWTRADEFAPEKASPAAWLLLVARSRVVGLLQHLQEKGHSGVDGTPSQRSETDAAELDLSPEARDTLDSLPDEQRSNPSLTFFDELTPVPPRAAIRGALMKRIAAAASNGSLTRHRPAAGVFIERGRKADWTSTGIPGARTRTLFIDRDRNLETFLMHLDPGCRLSLSEHAGPEQCLVLEGDLHAYDTVLQAGDYLRAPAGSSQGELHTESGCLLLIIAAVAGGAA